MLLAAILAPLAASEARAQSAAGEDQVRGQVIHASPAVGAVDLYVDGSLVFVGLTFGAVTDPIPMAAGNRELAAVPSGRSRDDALLATTAMLAGGSTVDVALLGPAADLRLGVFPVDLSPLPPDFARFGMVLGAVDTGPIDLAVTGADVLFPTLDFAGATEFADMAAGSYDLEVRYGGTESIALTLPGTMLASGAVTRLYVVGEATSGQLQPLIVSRQAEAAVIDGHPAWIQAGDCAAPAPAATAADLTIVSGSAFADPVGHAAAASSRSSFTTVEIAFDTLLTTAHAVTVAESAARPTAAIACGEIGGTAANDGSLVVGLRQVGQSGGFGVAVLAPNVVDPTTTDVAVYVVDGSPAAGGVLPAEEAGPSAASEPVEISAAAATVPATPAAVP